MPSPFPGMDPYLEHPGLWLNVHNSLIAVMRDVLIAALRPRYWVSIEERAYITLPDEVLFVGRSDVTLSAARERAPSLTRGHLAVAEPTMVEVEVPLPDEVTETYLEVRHINTQKTITVIEVLSLANKRPGQGRKVYTKKRMTTLTSRTHLVEIDLLRAGQPMLFIGDGHGSHYRLLISRAGRRPLAELYPFSVRHPIPALPVPLLPGDDEPRLDLNVLLREVYDKGGFDMVINYQAEPVPPLDGEEAAWADQLLRERGIR